MIWFMNTRNYLSENEIIDKYFYWECALIRIEELERLKVIENKFNSIIHIISMKDSNNNYTANI